MSFTQELKALAQQTGVGMDAGGPPGGAGRISLMDEERVIQTDAARPKSARPKDRARVGMIAREKRMTVEQRVEMFERLSRAVGLRLKLANLARGLDVEHDLPDHLPRGEREGWVRWSGANAGAAAGGGHCTAAAVGVGSLRRRGGCAYQR